MSTQATTNPIIRGSHLHDGDIFITLLTARRGIVVNRYGPGVGVILDSPDEEKTLSRSVKVRLLEREKRGRREQATP